MIYTMIDRMSLVRCVLFTVAIVLALPVGAQSANTASSTVSSVDKPASDSTARNPNSVQPERPTVATHAGTVARGWLELEEGGEWDRASDGARSFFAPTNLKIGLASRAQLNLLFNLIHDRSIRSGSFAPSDLTIGVKYRLVDDYRVLGDFAILPAVKLPTSSPSAAGTGTTDFSLL